MGKKIKLIMLLTVAALFSVSCSKEEGRGTVDNSPILGTWYTEEVVPGEMVTSRMELTWRFYRDNTAAQTLVLEMNGSVIKNVNLSFKYSYFGDSIDMESEKGRKFTYDISVSGNTMKLGSEEDGYFNLIKK